MTTYISKIPKLYVTKIIQYYTTGLDFTQTNHRKAEDAEHAQDNLYSRGLF